ncbi:unnamed protein product [Bemisia tabaci]|uniref:Uncharacterized protein n=1 Tax=Bemisia tabaci TaxID=7038 RepID=A0A9P0APX5_BEMTA|nr:unnamed protein product [Bemisia tabaci]
MRGSTAGITDGLKSTSRSYFLLLSFLDILMTTLVISPLVISYWRGTWFLMDIYLFPESPMRTALASIAIGFLPIFVFTLLQGAFADWLHPSKHRLLWYGASRLYTAAFGVACVNSWRGVWKTLDLYTGLETFEVSATTLFGVLFLLCIKCLRNISAVPFAIVTDRPEGYFAVPTMFKTSPKDNNIVLYSLDCFFSVFIIGSLLVFVWRGAWTLIDIFLFPGDPVFSAWYSLVIGYIVVFTTFALQPVVKKLVKKLEGFWRLCIVDAYLIFSFTGTINVWRGIWNLLSAYFIPSSPTTAAWVCHVGCFILLILINSSNSVLVRGVYVDAEEEGSKCVDFPCYYLRLFFLARRKKHLLRQFQKKQIHSLKRRKSEVDGYSGATESSAPQKSKVEEPPV